MKTITQTDDSNGACAESISFSALFKSRGSAVLVKDVMSRETITVSPQDSIFSAARSMAEHHVSCVAVVQEGGFAGILADKDVVQVVAEQKKLATNTKVAERMWWPTQVATEEMSILHVSRLMESLGVKWLPVLSERQLIGIVTQTDLTRALTACTEFTTVATVMSTDIITVNPASPAIEAARVMMSHEVSCVLAVHKDKVAGILTMKDILKTVSATDKHPDDIQVVEVMAFPVISIPPSYSFFSASRMMDRRHVHRLVVMDGDRLCGIVSQTDVLNAIRRTVLD